MSLSTTLLAVVLAPTVLVGIFVSMAISSVLLEYVIFVGEDDFE